MLNDKRKASLFLLIAILFGIYCFVFGQSGILERMSLVGIKETIDAEILQLEADNRTLFELLANYKSGTYLESEANKVGYFREGEIPLVFKEPAPYKQAPIEQEVAAQKLTETKQLRILWIVLSFIITFLYIIKRSSDQSAAESEKENRE